VFTSDAFSIFLALLGTVGVIVLTYYGSRWYVERFIKRPGSLSGGHHIQVIERLIVGKSGSIIIIDVQGVQYLVGVTEQQIQILSQLDEPISFQKKQELSKESFLSMVKSFSQKEKQNE
jgi:flagellar protein FliO/FliZ